MKSVVKGTNGDRRQPRRTRAAFVHDVGDALWKARGPGPWQNICNDALAAGHITVATSVPVAVNVILRMLSARQT